MSSMPWAARYLGKGMEPASGIPRATGPAPRNTSTCSGVMPNAGSSTRAASSGPSNTMAGPRCLCRCGDEVAFFITAPSGASEPFSTTRDDAGPSGASKVRIAVCHAPGAATSCKSAPRVWPLTPIASRSSIGSRVLSRTGTPPALSKSSIYPMPAGLQSTSSGTCWAAV